MLTDPRSRVSAGQQLSVNPDRTARRLRDDRGLLAIAWTCDGLDHIERGKARMLKQPVPCQHIGTPDIRRFENAEPVDCCVLTKMMHKDGLISSRSSNRSAGLS